LRLLVLGAQGAGKSFLTGLLLEDNEDVVEVGTWEDWEEGVSAADPGGVDSNSDVNGSFGYGKVLKASTDWLERRDSYGSDRYEPARNVHIVELPGYSQDADVSRKFRHYPLCHLAGLPTGFKCWKLTWTKLDSLGYRANNALERHRRGAIPCTSRCPPSRYIAFGHGFQSSRFPNVAAVHRNGIPFAVQ
jgi:hypothetical protein